MNTAPDVGPRDSRARTRFALTPVVLLGRSLTTGPMPHMEWTPCEDVSRAMRAILAYEQSSPWLMRRLGLPEESGAVRVSLVHNTIAEFDRFGNACCPIQCNARSGRG